MHNGIGGADVGKELVAKTFAFGGTLHQTGNVYEFDDGGGEFLGFVEIGQPVQALIGNGNNANIGVDGAECVVVRRNTGVGDCIKKGGFTHIGKAYDT